MKLDIEINEDEIVRLAVDKLGKPRKNTPRRAWHGVRNTRGHKIAVINIMVYEQGA